MISWCCHDTHEFLIDFLNLLQERVYRISHWFTNAGGHFSAPSQFFFLLPPSSPPLALSSYTGPDKLLALALFVDQRGRVGCGL